MLSGVAEDVDADGSLRLRTDSGKVVRVVAGEVNTANER
jgi:biotin-(acetyl-CoA carboxylase) ligase